MSESTAKVKGGAGTARDDDGSQHSGPPSDQEEEFHCGMGDPYTFLEGSDRVDSPLSNGSRESFEQAFKQDQASNISYEVQESYREDQAYSNMTFPRPMNSPIPSVTSDVDVGPQATPLHLQDTLGVHSDTTRQRPKD